MNLKEISEILQIKSPHVYLKNLLKLGWIQCYEAHQEKYRPKTVSKINLHSRLKKDKTLLEDAFKNLSRAPKQEELLLKFLQFNQELSGKAILKKKLLRTSEMIGKSAAIEQIKMLIERVAPTDARVLITGENGTGKEMVARLTACFRFAQITSIAVSCKDHVSDIVSDDCLVVGSKEGVKKLTTGCYAFKVAYSRFVING